jgi:hypothetical protein
VLRIVLSLQMQRWNNTEAIVLALQMQRWNQTEASESASVRLLDKSDLAAGAAGG